MSPIETAIIRKILQIGTQNNLRFRVFDGEEFASYEPSNNIPSLTKAIGNTDETTLHVFRPNHMGHPQYVGHIYLVHGNEEDLVADIGGADDTELDRLDGLFGNIRYETDVQQESRAARDKLVGMLLHVSLEPYHGGIARVVSSRQSHEFNRPDKTLDGQTTLVVEAVEMTETARLFSATSTKKVTPGNLFEMHFYDCQLPRIIEDRIARYTYPV